MISLQQVEKYFFKDEPREIHALIGINLTINHAEFSVLTGPSGCGKTTLLNAIGLLDTINSGTISINNTEVSSLNEKEKTLIRRDQIGFVFQSYNLIPVLNVYDNIAFIMRLQQQHEADIDTRVKELANKLEIENRLSALPQELSGGQQQRVAVARAVASRPSIVLADEPTANLDSENATRLMQLMHQLNQEEQITILFASHDEYVVREATRIIKLYDGAIIA